MLIGLFVALAAVSFAWSATRAVTALAVVVLLVTTYVALVTVRGHASGRFMVLLYRGLQASLAIGLLFELIVSVVIRHPIEPLGNDIARIADDHGTADKIWWSQNLLFEGGPIQGFVGNRNPFGAIALLAGIMAFVDAARASRSQGRRHCHPRGRRRRSPADEVGDRHRGAAVRDHPVARRRCHPARRPWR